MSDIVAANGVVEKTQIMDNWPSSQLENEYFYCSWEWHIARLSPVCALIYSHAFRVSGGIETPLKDMPFFASAAFRLCQRAGHVNFLSHLAEMEAAAHGVQIHQAEQDADDERRNGSLVVHETKYPLAHEEHKAGEGPEQRQAINAPCDHCKDGRVNQRPAGDAQHGMVENDGCDAQRGGQDGGDAGRVRAVAHLFGSYLRIFDLGPVVGRHLGFLSG